MSETKHQRANRLMVEARLIALRDGQTRDERLRIYERELLRLTSDTSAGEAPADSVRRAHLAGDEDLAGLSLAQIAGDLPSGDQIAVRAGDD
jgi:hypothetical protein